VVADLPPRHVEPGEAVALDVHVVSDERHPIEGATVTATLLGGPEPRRWAFAGDVGADAVQRVGQVRFTAPPAPGSLTLELVLRLAADDPEAPAAAVNHYEVAVVAPSSAGTGRKRTQQ
jgi:hypothetical protein